MNNIQFNKNNNEGVCLISLTIIIHRYSIENINAYDQSVFFGF